MLLKEIVNAHDAIAGTRGRNKKRDAVAGVIAAARGEDLDIAVAFLAGELRQGKIGLGYAAVRDLDKPPPADDPSLELVEVDAAFLRIKETKGKGSKQAKLDELGALYARATAGEQKLLGRLVVGELRQGALEGVMAEGIARAAGLEGAKVRRAAMLAGDLRAVARAAVDEGEAGLARFRLELFRPVQPMLAQTAEGAEAAIAKLERASLEYKLDGARVQVHKDGDEVRVFTRRLHEVTRAVPEVVEAVRALPARSLVLDGETLALRPDGRPRPFQETMRRFGRKLDVEKMREKLPLSVWFFDLLLADDEEALDLAQEERGRIMDALLPPELVVPRLTTAAPEEAEAFFDRALADGHEGLVAKLPSATYEAGRRGAGWLKIKPAHTLDLVVLAAEWGSGRREGWLSNLHLGARDGDGWAMLGKTFKGLTDARLQWQTQALLERETERNEWQVFVRPELVVEIAFDGVQESPHYESGHALRFARVKGYRSDKGPEDASTLDEVKAIFRKSRA